LKRDFGGAKVDLVEQGNLNGLARILLSVWYSTKADREKASNALGQACQKRFGRKVLGFSLSFGPS
jgi:hypothetical protein